MGKFFYKPSDKITVEKTLNLEDFVRSNYEYKYVSTANIDYTEKNYLFFSIFDSEQFNLVDCNYIASQIPDNENLSICISYPMECYIPAELKDFMDHMLFLYPKAQFFFSHANAYSKELSEYPFLRNRTNKYCTYEDWCRIKYISYPLFEMLYHEYITNSSIEAKPHKELSKKFLMPIRQAKPWRIMFYLWCRDNGILSNSHYSWTTEALYTYMNECEQHEDYHKIPLWQSFDNDDVEFLKESVILDPIDTRDILQKQWEIPDEFYTTSFAQIVLETTFDNRSEKKGETIFITEKTYKSIFYGQPFFLISEPNSLQYLRDLGYMTFGEVFDESYDEEMNLHKRMKLVTNQIKKFNGISLDSLTSYREILKEVTEYNQKHFQTLPSKKRIIHNLNRILFNEQNVDVKTNDQ